MELMAFKCDENIAAKEILIAEKTEILKENLQAANLEISILKEMVTGKSLSEALIFALN